MWERQCYAPTLVLHFSHSFQEKERLIAVYSWKFNVVWDSLFCQGTWRFFGCVSPWTHFCLFLDDHWNSVSGLGIERRFNSRLEGLWHFVYKINSHYQNSQEWPSVHELMCNNPQYQPFEAASWGQGQTQCQFLLVRESDVHVLNHICLSPLISNCMKSVRKSGFLF